ncbi:MAG TPA: lipopolysaccharide biosynthesis protein [Tepidisphaeraceae bacterium]|jgi:O-antigen/teichoic acid export membrane protein|nr:lipopolysaccharide biosynthesis protein [Tepidisphaeraceae bacterium]
MRRDISAAYLSAAARIGAWAAVSALVYRAGGAGQFAILALVRGTIGILNYTSVGLTPALIRMLAEARAKRASARQSPAAVLSAESPLRLEYATPDPQPQDDAAIYSSGILAARLSIVAGICLTIVYAFLFRRMHAIPRPLSGKAPAVVFWIGCGTLLRLYSDVAGALLQTRGRIALDNWLLAAGEMAWVVVTFFAFAVLGMSPLLSASAAYFISGLLLVAARRWAVHRLADGPREWSASAARAAVVKRLFAFGSLVLLAQVADYLYSPTDFLLIAHFLRPVDVAAYAPAVQIDSGLLMLVTALAAVLLPRAALAHTGGDVANVRRYYVRGTLASTAILVPAAAGVWAASPVLFRLWFGPNAPATRAILPLVLIHTVIGGSSAAGRSVLLAMGKVKPYTAGVLIAGATNVIASYCFVKYAGWGLRGIIFGTIIAVVGRCALWMPWYVLRTLRREEGS